MRMTQLPWDTETVLLLGLLVLHQVLLTRGEHTQHHRGWQEGHSSHHRGHRTASGRSQRDTSFDSLLQQERNISYYRIQDARQETQAAYIIDSLETLGILSSSKTKCYLVHRIVREILPPLSGQADVRIAVQMVFYERTEKPATGAQHRATTGNQKGEQAECIVKASKGGRSVEGSHGNGGEMPGSTGTPVDTNGTGGLGNASAAGVNDKLSEGPTKVKHEHQGGLSRTQVMVISTCTVVIGAFFIVAMALRLRNYLKRRQNAEPGITVGRRPFFRGAFRDSHQEAGKPTLAAQLAAKDPKLKDILMEVDHVPPDDPRPPGSPTTSQGYGGESHPLLIVTSASTPPSPDSRGSADLIGPGGKVKKQDVSEESFMDQYGVYIGEPEKPDPTQSAAESGTDDCDQYGVYIGEPMKPDPPQSAAESGTDDCDQYGVYIGEPLKPDPTQSAAKSGTDDCDQYGVYIGEPVKPDPPRIAPLPGKNNTSKGDARDVVTVATDHVTALVNTTPSCGMAGPALIDTSPADGSTAGSKNSSSDAGEEDRCLMVFEGGPVGDRSDRRNTAPPKMLSDLTRNGAGFTQSQTSLNLATNNPPYMYGNQSEYSMVDKGLREGGEAEEGRDSLGVLSPERGWASTGAIRGSTEPEGGAAGMCGMVPPGEVTFSSSSPRLNIHSIRERHSLPHVLPGNPAPRPETLPQRLHRADPAATLGGASQGPPEPSTQPQVPLTPPGGQHRQRQDELPSGADNSQQGITETSSGNSTQQGITETSSGDSTQPEIKVTSGGGSVQTTETNKELDTSDGKSSASVVDPLPGERPGSVELANASPDEQHKTLSPEGSQENLSWTGSTDQLIHSSSSPDTVTTNPPAHGSPSPDAASGDRLLEKLAKVRKLNLTDSEQDLNEKSKLLQQLDKMHSTFL